MAKGSRQLDMHELWLMSLCSDDVCHVAIRCHLTSSRTVLRITEALPFLPADILDSFGSNRQTLLAATVTAKQATASGLTLGSAALDGQLPASQLPLAAEAQQLRIC
jgi:hypothetical protein